MPNTQMTADTRNEQCDSMPVTLAIPKNDFTLKYENISIDIEPIVRPNVRTFAGSSSTKQIIGTGIMPKVAMKEENPMLIIGTHVNIDISYPEIEQ